MGVIESLKKKLGARGGNVTDRGAYWCDECQVRIRDVELDEGEKAQCPKCEKPMRFERSFPGGAY